MHRATALTRRGGPRSHDCGGDREPAESDLLRRRVGSVRREQPDHHTHAFDWTHGGEATFLLGAQLGNVVHIGKQVVSVSIEAGGAVTQPSTTPSTGWIVGIEFTPIFKGHIK